MAFSELIGYVASALVVMSLAMTSVIRLRIVNLAGSVMFLAYGLMIESIPIVLANIVITGLNLWFLRNAYTDESVFGLIQVDPSSPFLSELVGHHVDDIRRFQPGFDASDSVDVALPHAS
jgi:hypothetical protein